MDAYSLFLTIQWLLPLWLLGWLILPISLRIFWCLPDAGLAAGRILALLLVSLVAFWGASLQILALPLAPLLFLLPVLAALWLLWRGSRNKEYLSTWRNTLRDRKKALLISDAIFTLAFLLFVLLRLFRPEINEFEKPMDSAIIGSLSRSTFLPAENPWFAGLPFTNYYFFGHFMASLLKRLFETPLPYAYNLIQPLFCALFLSTLWSLCAALCRSSARGVLATVIVAVFGNFEPLRQWLSPPAGLNRSGDFPFLDWWSTSRVISNTINEYPFFTLVLGDAHAHFFALPLAAFFLCSCCAYFKSTSRHGLSLKEQSRERLLCSATICLSLAAILMTNAWDFPLYALLAMLVVLVSPGAVSLFSIRVLRACSLPLFSIVPALPLLLRFESQVGGIQFELWTPPAGTFYLMWGGFLLLLCLLVGLENYVVPQRRHEKAQPVDLLRQRPELTLAVLLLLLAPLWPPLLPLGLLLLLLAVSISFSKIQQQPKPTGNMLLIWCMLFVGIAALLLPFFCYLQGYFSLELRRQDTIFKLGLQAWLLLGTGVTCGLLSTIADRQEGKSPLWKPSRVPLLVLIGLLWMAPVACSLSVVISRTGNFGRTGQHQRLSLNGARSFSAGDQQAMMWLEATAPTSALVIEAVGRDEKGNFHAAYSNYGLVSALTGVPAYIGWPQHARFWGAPHHEIQQRLLQVESVFAGAPESQLPSTHALHGHTTFVFLDILADPNARFFLEQEGTEVFRSGYTAIYSLD